MKDFKSYYNVVAKSAEATGQLPRVRDYIVVKLVENVFIVLLFGLTMFFSLVALFASSVPSEERKWAFNAASLCLGVFLGLFAGRKL